MRGLSRAARLSVFAALCAFAAVRPTLAQEQVLEPELESAASPEPSAEGEAEAEADPFDEFDEAESGAVEEDELDDSEFDLEEPILEDAYGQPIEELLVTGRQSDSLAELDDANSITSFDSQDLQALGIADVADLSDYTPNLEIIAANPSSPTFFIRGVGLSDFNANSTGAVAVFVDDVPFNAPSLQSGIVFDAERINVLKGPQGTGPNRNASAGAIKTYSRPPSDQLGANLRATYGSYDFVDLEGGFDVPIVGDVLLSRISGRFMRRDGLTTNRCGNAPPFDEREVRNTLPNPPITGSICGEWVQNNQVSALPIGLRTTVNDMFAAGARLQLLWAPEDLEMEWMLNGHMTIRDQLAPLGQSAGTSGTQFDENGDPTFGILGGTTNIGYVGQDVFEMITTRRDELRDEGLSFNDALNQARIETADELADNLDIRPFVGDYNRTGRLRNLTAGGFVRGDVSFTDRLAFRTITAFDFYDRFNDQDVDSTPDELFELKNDDQGFQFTQDLLLESGAEEWFGWDTGFYYLAERIDSEIETFTGQSPVGNTGIQDRGYEQTIHSWAAWGSIDVDFWDDLNFFGGLRYNWERKSMDYGLLINTQPREAEDTQTWSAPTWTLRLTYRMNDEIEVFAKYSRGWKSGHFNAVGNLVDGTLGFADPETLDSWEAGFRGLWWENRIALSSTFFYYRYKDYQVFTFDQGFGVTPELIITNANDAENYGAEVDLTLNPIDDLLGMVRFGWLESRFLDFTQQNVISTEGPNGQTIGVPVLVDYTGNRLINSPQFQVTFMGQYQLDVGRYGVLVPRYDATWKSASYFDASEGVGPPNTFQGQPFLPENTLGQGPYWLHNARLTWMCPDWNVEVSGWVRNFMDERYKVGGFNASGFADFVVRFVGEPRTGGVDVNVRF